MKSINFGAYAKKLFTYPSTISLLCQSAPQPPRQHKQQLHSGPSVQPPAGAMPNRLRRVGSHPREKPGKRVPRLGARGGPSCPRPRLNAGRSGGSAPAAPGRRRRRHCLVCQPRGAGRAATALPSRPPPEAAGSRYVTAGRAGGTGPPPLAKKGGGRRSAATYRPHTRLTERSRPDPDGSLASRRVPPTHPPPPRPPVGRGAAGAHLRKPEGRGGA